MEKQVFLIVNKKHNDLHTSLGPSLEVVSKREQIQFENTEHRPAGSWLLGEGTLDIPLGLEPYAEAICSLERCFLGGGGQIRSIIEHALRTGFKLGVEYADEVRTRQIWMR